MKKIYIADDEKDILQLLKIFLEKEGFQTATFETGEDLLACFEQKPADLLIIDIMMPGMDGLTLCSRIRKISNIPIIILTARDTDADMITGFTVGCDDYFTKPFSPLKLTLRVKAIFARMEQESKEELYYGDIIMYPLKKMVYLRGEEIKLTGTEYVLLQYLIINENRAVSRDELLNVIWGYEKGVETRVTDDTVKRLRKKLLAKESIVSIETVWGFGFKLKAGKE